MEGSGKRERRVTIPAGRFQEMRRQSFTHPSSSPARSYLGFTAHHNLVLHPIDKTHSLPALHSCIRAFVSWVLGLLLLLSGRLLSPVVPQDGQDDKIMTTTWDRPMQRSHVFPHAAITIRHSHRPEFDIWHIPRLIDLHALPEIITPSLLRSPKKATRNPHTHAHTHTVGRI